LEQKDAEIPKPDIYVIARFLERIWTVGKPIKKTRLQMAVGLNYGTFKKYLVWMVDRDLLSLTMEKDKDWQNYDNWRELNVQGMARHLLESGALQ